MFNRTTHIQTCLLCPKHKSRHVFDSSKHISETYGFDTQTNIHTDSRSRNTEPHICIRPPYIHPYMYFDPQTHIQTCVSISPITYPHTYSPLHLSIHVLCSSTHISKHVPSTPNMTINKYYLHTNTHQNTNCEFRNVYPNLFWFPRPHIKNMYFLI